MTKTPPRSPYKTRPCATVVSSVMGRVASSPRVIVTSPSSCFCSWSARGCHKHAIREETASPSRTRDPVRRPLTTLRTASPLPSSRRRDLREAGCSCPAPNCSSSFPALRRRGLPAPAKGRAIPPYAVENDRKLARQRHLRSLHAAPLRHLQGPTLEGREAHRPRQQDVRGLIQGRSHHHIAHSADRARDVRLAGLVLARGQPEVRPHPFGAGEPLRGIHA